VDEKSSWDNNKARLFIYKKAIGNAAGGIGCREQAFCTVFCICVLATHFDVFATNFQNWHGVVFVSSPCIPLCS
jgi:hypothetical protein